MHYTFEMMLVGSFASNHGCMEPKRRTILIVSTCDWKKSKLYDLKYSIYSDFFYTLFISCSQTLPPPHFHPLICHVEWVICANSMWHICWELGWPCKKIMRLTQGGVKQSLGVRSSVVGQNNACIYTQERLNIHQQSHYFQINAQVWISFLFVHNNTMYKQTIIFFSDHLFLAL